MIIHIITHDRSSPVEAYLNKAQAKDRYKELRQEQPEYGLVSLEIKGTDLLENLLKLHYKKAKLRVIEPYD
ncbi:MAG: hypothetical protein KKE05_05325 [Nanoarchaeota archaeon]|nr:hypothetical protein [Nanoarchaeota archaeon]